MTKVPMGKPSQRMGTLDKLWGSIPEEDDDTMTVDIGGKPEEKLMDNKTNRTETVNPTTTETTYQPSTNIVPLFPMTIRFCINATSVSQAYNQHIDILQAIKQKMKHCDVYSKETEKVKFEDISVSDFDYHELDGKQKTFIVVHRLVLDQKYHHLKKQKDIFDCIKRNKCFLQEHAWTSKQWDIINVGFLSGVSSKHQSKDSVKHKLDMIEKTKLHYNLHATLINSIHNGVKHSTYAYEIQCQRQHANEISNYIAHSSREYGHTFIKYKWKYTHPEVFVNAINKQNDFINSIRTIPIYGITNAAMSTMHDELLKKKEILEISGTSKTTELGRWNIYTKLTNFHSTIKWLQINLIKLYDNLQSDVKKETPVNFQPEVRFNTTIVFDHDKDPLLQYAVQAVDSFSETSSTNTWISEPSNQTWASVAAGSKAPSSLTTTSELTKTMKKLSESIATICTRLEKIEQTLTKHSEAINHAQSFEKQCNDNMQKLVTFIEQLEDRTARIKPRKLDEYYDTSESNKRQNTNQSPRKAPPS